MKTLTVAVLATLTLTVSAFGQSQDGSVAIAESIRAKDDDSTMGGYAACVVKLKQAGTADKEARKDCREAMKIMAHTSTRIANEAADATKASRQVCCGYGYGGYGGGWGGGYSRTYWGSASHDNYPSAPVQSPQQVQAEQQVYAAQIRSQQQAYAAQIRAQQEAEAAQIRAQLQK
jgi:hypothetical protein